MKSSLQKYDSPVFFHELFATSDLEWALDSYGLPLNIYYAKSADRKRILTIYKGEDVLSYFVYKDGEFYAIPENTETLVEYALEKYKLTQKDGHQLFFSDPFSCKLTGLCLPDGTQFHFTYNMHKQLIDVRNSRGLVISLKRNKEQVLEIKETLYRF